MMRHPLDLESPQGAHQRAAGLAELGLVGPAPDHQAIIWTGGRPHRYPSEIPGDTADGLERDDRRARATRAPKPLITTLTKASSKRHAIPGCETIRLSKPSRFLGRGEGLIERGQEGPAFGTSRDTARTEAPPDPSGPARAIARAGTTPPERLPATTDEVHYQPLLPRADKGGANVADDRAVWNHRGCRADRDKEDGNRRL